MARKGAQMISRRTIMADAAASGGIGVAEPLRTVYCQSD